MLTQPQLLALHRSLRNARVLSVYLDGSATDPALQRSWRLQLDHSLSELREWLAESPRAEMSEFETCVEMLDASIRDFDPNVGSPGWVAFITAEGIRHTEALPTPMPTLAVWSNGPCIAPYVRALKENRPVIVAVADARSATLHTYRGGKLAHVENIRSYHVVDAPSHMGTPSRQGYHTGTRGSTGHDAAQRSQLKGRDRMISEAVGRIAELAGDDGWIVVGGIKRIVSRVAEQLDELAPNRVLELSSLDVHASDAEIEDIARSAASSLRNTFDTRRLADITDEAGAHHLGALGPEETRRALDHACVRDLYMTHHYVEEHAPDAELAVRIALEQDASVEEVSGSAAEFLDARGGMAAGLRFRPALIEEGGSA